LRINGTNEITGIYIPREKKYCIFEEKLRWMIHSKKKKKKTKQKKKRHLDAMK
jgi:hypothetical protein